MSERTEAAKRHLESATTLYANIGEGEWTAQDAIGSLLASDVEELLAENARLREALEPGKASAIVTAMFELAEQYGHSPVSSKHALSFFHERLAEDAARRKAS